MKKCFIAVSMIFACFQSTYIKPSADPVSQRPSTVSYYIKAGLLVIGVTSLAVGCGTGVYADYNENNETMEFVSALSGLVGGLALLLGAVT